VRTLEGDLGARQGAGLDNQDAAGARPPSTRGREGMTTKTITRRRRVLALALGSLIALSGVTAASAA
jgi:hypothetical protein